MYGQRAAPVSRLSQGDFSVLPDVCGGGCAGVVFRMQIYQKTFVVCQLQIAIKKMPAKIFCSLT